jgi:pentatricopeptide repeat protein
VRRHVDYYNRTLSMLVLKSVDQDKKLGFKMVLRTFIDLITYPLWDANIQCSRTPTAVKQHYEKVAPKDSFGFFSDVSGAAPSEESYTLVIYAACKAGNWQEAIQLLRVMQRESRFLPVYLMVEKCIEGKI